MHTRSIVAELLWFLQGSTNVKWLHEQGVTIWDEWADADGELGPIYGYQWRSWPTPDDGHVDQIARVIDVDQDQSRLAPAPGERLERGGSGPDGAAAVPHDVPVLRGARPEGHPDQRARLSCQLYQRSADIFLGVPFNIASYALLTHLVAQVTGLAVGDFVHTLGDAHLYTNHLDQARLQLTREPRPLPRLELNPAETEIDDFEISRHRDRRIRPASGHQSPDRGLTPMTGLDGAATPAAEPSSAASGTEVVAIAAVARNGVIGAGGDIPWRIPEDWARFKRLTMGQVLIMGRKTYDSIGRALPGRTTYVITRDRMWRGDGVRAVPAVDEAIDLGLASDSSDRLGRGWRRDLPRGLGPARPARDHRGRRRARRAMRPSRRSTPLSGGRPTASATRGSPS